MRIQNWPIPYARNPRTISDRAIDKVAASIAEFGWRQPIVVDQKGVVVVGYARLLAAKKLGHAKVPIHVAEGLSSAQIRAYRLADNRLNQDTAWDEELLSLELAELDSFDLALSGFEPGELNALVSPTGGHTGEDEAPAAPVEPLGDVWRCGAHLLPWADAAMLAMSLIMRWLFDPHREGDPRPEFRERSARARRSRATTEQAAQECRWGLLDTIATADAERIRRGERLRPLIATKGTLIGSEKGPLRAFAAFECRRWASRCDGCLDCA